jgi:hypothetical protein
VNLWKDLLSVIKASANQLQEIVDRASATQLACVAQTSVYSFFHPTFLSKGNKNVFLWLQFDEPAATALGLHPAFLRCLIVLCKKGGELYFF